MVFELFSTCGSVIEKNIDGFQNENVNVSSVGNISGRSGGVDMSCAEILLLILIIVVCTLPAVVIAVTYNPKNPVLMGIIAFLFDRIYLFQHVYRKYIIREKNYCKNISCRN
tara:strand:+ start:603 stop:938 length:336 start_codon:yes stop_codon:yes gene_type:complete